MPSPTSGPSPDDDPSKDEESHYVKFLTLQAQFDQYPATSETLPDRSAAAGAGQADRDRGRTCGALRRRLPGQSERGRLPGVAPADRRFLQRAASSTC